MTIDRGYWGKILSIDLTTKTYSFDERDATFWRDSVGGGLAAATLLLERTGSGVDPLGPQNMLMFTSSVVAGHLAPGLARFSVCAKSPLTDGIGETRCEGPWGAALKRSGVDMLAFSGRSNAPLFVVINQDCVEFHDARNLWGTSTGAATDALEQLLGNDIEVAVIGPAGERSVRFASIVADRSYQAARMGMGAVMGAKNLKAVVLRGGEYPQLAEPESLAQIAESYSQRMLRNDLTKWQHDPPGFSCWLYLHGLDAALCVNNYQRSGIDGIEAFAADRFLERPIQELGCPGCPNKCIKSIHPRMSNDLDPRASGIHQEVTGTMGPNLGIADLDFVLRANNLCNQFGLDPTSLGFTLSCAMELFQRGLLTAADNQGKAVHFGDQEGALELIDSIVARTGLGDTLAEGSRRACQAIDPAAVAYAMQVKGLEMVCFEPRSQTNLALGYAVAPIGPRYDICEHDWDFDTEVGWHHTLELSRTLGVLRRIPMGYTGPDKVRYFKALYSLWSAADALDFCIFAIAPTRVLSLPEMALILRASTGWQTSAYEIMRIGERRAHLMRWYNLREGLSRADDRLPERFYRERISEGPRKGDILDSSTFEQAVETYYGMMGWDREGRPTATTLYDAGLEWLLTQ